MDVLNEAACEIDTHRGQQRAHHVQAPRQSNKSAARNLLRTVQIAALPGKLRRIGGRFAMRACGDFRLWAQYQPLFSAGRNSCLGHTVPETPFLRAPKTGKILSKDSPEEVSCLCSP
jgi:hypothetical protein